MSLKIRRGLDADRIGITFDEGEIVYATDTKIAYIGDGLTPGGVPISGSIAGQVDSIIAGENVNVDATDPINPEVSVPQALFDAKANETDLTTHTGTTTIHFLEGDIDHTAIQNVGTKTHTVLEQDITDLNANKEPVISPKNTAFNKAFGAITDTVCEGNDARLSDDRDPNPHTHTESNITDLDKYTQAQVDSLLVPKLEAVVEDTAPELGGTLGTLGNYIAIEQTNGTVVAGIKDEPDGTGAAFFRTLDGLYDENDGAVLVGSGVAKLGGTTAIVNALANETGDKQVYCDQNGTLYGVEPPVPGWEVPDTDNGVYSLVDNGLWLNMTGLAANIPADKTVDAGVPLNVGARVHVTNASNRTGTIALNVGVNGVVTSGDGVAFNIAVGFNSSIVLNISWYNHGGLASNQTVSIFGKFVSESGPGFTPVLDGSVAGHALVISVDGEAGSGGVSSHPDLTNRNAADQHTTFAITGLDDTLATKSKVFYQETMPDIAGDSVKPGDIYIPEVV